MSIEKILSLVVFLELFLIAFKIYESYFKLHKVVIKKFLAKNNKIKTFLEEHRKSFDADYCFLLQFRNGDRFTAGNEVMRIEILQEAMSDAFLDLSLFETNLKSIKANKFLDILLMLNENKFVIIDASEKISQYFPSKKALRQRNMMIGYYHKIYNRFGEMIGVLCFEYAEGKMPVPLAPYPAKLEYSLKELRFLIEK